MDGERFDAIARRLAGPATRRGAVRLLVGGALSTTAVFLGLGSREALACKARGATCLTPGDCCSGNCGCGPTASGRVVCTCRLPFSGAAKVCRLEGATCKRTTQCCSGPCGCVGDKCTCRKASCEFPGDRCTPFDNASCCKGKCKLKDRTDEYRCG